MLVPFSYDKEKKMKLNLEMEIDDNMSVDDLRRKVRRFICVINHEQTIIDHHYVIEKNGKKFDYKRHQKKIAKSSNKRMLKETDFEVEKLSTRLGLLKFEGYITITDNVQNKVYYSVTCTCVSTKRRVAIEVAGSTDNEYLIKQLSEKSSSLNEMYVDFDDCIVGHHIRGHDYFPMIVQTYQAESLKIL